MRKKFPLLPNVITAFGLSCGLFVIFKLCLVPNSSVNESLLTQSVGILLLAALADILDGAVARLLKAESDFGGLFDCLADAIVFGVAPAVVVMKSFSFGLHDKLAFILMGGAMIYTICGVLRLIRFALTSSEAKEDAELALLHKKHFTGLPIPAAAAGIISLNLFLFSQGFQEFFPLSDETRVWILFGGLLVIGYFMVSRWKFPSIKTLRIPVASFEKVFFLVASAILIFYGIVTLFPLTLFIGAWGYIVTAWVLSIIRLIAGKKSKTLEAFEPDDEEFEE